VIPAYNEEDAIEHTIRSWMSVDYPHDRYEVIVVNDGSTDQTCARVLTILPEFAEHPLHFHTYHDNRGKRAAQKIGFDRARGEIIIIADSDSVPATSDAVRHLIQPFQDAKVGGVCGQTDVSNVTNWLTKIQKVRYWTAFDRFKRCESLADGVTCLSGCFSAIRRVALDEVIDEWYTQTFLGKQTSYGDDRTLTMLLLKRGWNTMYAPEAQAKTIVPETFTKYWKQQLRWTKSFIRETYLGSQYIWRRPKIAFQFYLNGFFSFVSFFIAVYTLILVTLLSYGTQFPYIYLFGFIVISLLYAVNYRIYNADNTWIWAPVWSLMDSLILVWKLPVALVELRNTKWGTR
jgi:hyaluronan synthase